MWRACLAGAGLLEQEGKGQERKKGARLLPLSQMASQQQQKQEKITATSAFCFFHPSTSQTLSSKPKTPVNIKQTHNFQVTFKDFTTQSTCLAADALPPVPATAARTAPAPAAPTNKQRQDSIALIVMGFHFGGSGMDV
ncbi:hypothetical protein CKAH01_13910 [Colletotrichum kahawae]|uniref:Uncharacterized protein n=1 Tax=Colletotrichum kahawae TaxID=34407 RepID=A0AAE0DDD7_COLKA|nr:hypothetical protein CKAH01_13910 [Colletotrichum kahawae]